MTTRKKLFGVLLLSTFTSCVIDYYDKRLKIVNQSDNVICFDHDLDTTLDVPSINKKEYFISTRMEPGDTNRVILTGSATQWIKEVSSGKDSTLSIFVFDFYEVLNNEWDSLRMNRKYKRLDYKLNELKAPPKNVTIKNRGLIVKIGINEKDKIHREPDYWDS